jgi:osmoprotectant transport system ATP-binding protein
MGDRIALLRDGRLVQCGSPAQILAAPASAFVEEFVGTDRALKRLQLVPVRELALEAPIPAGETITIGREASANDALALMLASNRDALTVVDAQDRFLSVLGIEAGMTLSRGGVA